jgi:GntR family transcriptional regulator, rspAB operon transcriptional repressor
VVSTSRESSVASRVHAALREAIVRLEIAPGEALSEKGIADRLGTSRTPAREALIRLVAEGLVEVVPQVGTFITRIDLSEVTESVFIRVAIETAAARDAAAQSSAIAIATMRGVLEDQRSAVQRGDFAGLVETDERFHYEIFLAGDHPRAWQVVQSARHHLDRVRMLHREFEGASDSEAPEAATMRGSLAQHRRILEAIARGDAAAAALETEDHVRSIMATAPLIAATRPDLFVPARPGPARLSWRTNDPGISSVADPSADLAEELH